MPPEQATTKRERQKARRDAQRAAEQARRARARRIRLGAIALGLILVLGGAAFAFQQRQASTQFLEVARTEAGCTTDTEMPDLGGGHLEAPDEIAASPPQSLYPDRPATSGQHLLPVVASGTYERLIDERSLVHNLEHGYTIAYYSPTAPQDQVDALKSWADAQISGDYPKIIVAPWVGEALPQGKGVAFTAWGFRQMCDTFSPEVAQSFVEAHSGLRSRAPEEGQVPVHDAEIPGRVAVPNDGNFLFPPLDAEFGGDEPNLAEEGVAPPAP